MKHKGAETATKHFKLPVNILLLLFLRFIAYLFRCEDTKKNHSNRIYMGNYFLNTCFPKSTPFRR